MDTVVGVITKPGAIKIIQEDTGVWGVMQPDQMQVGDVESGGLLVVIVM